MYTTEWMYLDMLYSIGGARTMYPPVASFNRPPNVMTGVKQAKYRKTKDARH